MVSVPRNAQKRTLFGGFRHASFSDQSYLVFDCFQCLGFGGVEAEEEGTTVLFDYGFVFAQGLDEGNTGATSAAAAAAGTVHAMRCSLICRHDKCLSWVEKHASALVEVCQDGVSKFLPQCFVHGQGSFSLIRERLVQDARALVPDLGDPLLVGTVPVHAHVRRVARGAGFVLLG